MFPQIASIVCLILVFLVALRVTEHPTSDKATCREKINKNQSNDQYTFMSVNPGLAVYDCVYEKIF